MIHKLKDFMGNILHYKSPKKARKLSCKQYECLSV